MNSIKLLKWEYISNNLNKGNSNIQLFEFRNRLKNKSGLQTKTDGNT